MRNRRNTLVALAFTFVLGACQSKDEYPNRYFDYSGKDGCSPPNIGHGLGGDLPGNAPNTLEGMMAISSMQSSDCFKNWEVDLNQAADVIVLSHDSTFGGRDLGLLSRDQLPEGISTLDEFASALVKLDLQKPLILDIKKVSNPDLWPEMRKAARTIKQHGKIPVWFTIDDIVADAHAGICAFLNGEFEVMLYRRGGPLCV
jgi:hypothetical protein